MIIGQTGLISLASFVAPIVICYVGKNMIEERYTNNFSFYKHKLDSSKHRLVTLAPYFAELTESQQENARIFADKFRDQIKFCEEDYSSRQGHQCYNGVAIDYE
jgi:hypothetical protein